jgi:formylglycine-generating enzyme required for sulfatase activity
VSTFISYSRADSGFAVRLAKNLRSAGFDVWLDQLDIPTGARWDDEVEAALESCKIFMIILSPESLESQNVKDEIGYAIDSGKEILPVKIKAGEIPFRLRRFQYVDFSKQSYQESLREIKSLLSAASPPSITEEPDEAEASPTVRRIKAVASAPDPHVTKPSTKRPESAGSSTQRTPSRGLLIGVAAVGILAIAGLIARSLGAERSSTATPSSEAPIAESGPTEQPTGQPTSEATEASVDAGQPETVSTTFSQPNDLADWENFIVGRPNKVAVSQSNDGLIFRLSDTTLRAYYVYRPRNYEDTSIRMKAENLGQKSFRVSLVCRKAGDLWYEFTVIGGGLWQLHEHNTKYILRDSGGTSALNARSNSNEYEMLCIGDELTLRINGQDVTTYQIKINPIMQGQVGFSISSSEVFPIDMKVLEFEASDQSAGEAVDASTSSPHAASSVALDQDHVRVSQKDGMTMVLVPEGEFMMGSDEGEPNETPRHSVYVNAFWIDRTEITNRMFAAFLNSEATNPDAASTWVDAADNDLHVHFVDGMWKVDPGYEEHPAIEMRWIGAFSYCGWREDGTRLPTEAEWEKAAGGTTENLYPWGNQISCELANYGTCKGNTVPVGSYPSNVSPFGALDMTGNVMEWVMDWYSEGYYRSSPAANPTGPDSGQYRVLRGASFDEHNDYQARLTFRFIEAPDESKDDAGFRCVLPA